MLIGNKEFDTENEKYIVAILNVTPDSFSDGGWYNKLDEALYRTRDLIAQGASIIDVGGESTRPGYRQISEEEEIDRVAPIISAIKQRFDIPISVDTYKSHVARVAIEEGANLVNDIWGLKYDPYMADVIKQADVACCLMHNREKAVYGRFLEEVNADLRESVDIALKAGISQDKIIIDPGIGFAKDYNQNLEMLGNLEKLKTLGYPILLGTSRKSVIGLTLEVPVEERVAGTVATTVIGAMKGASFFRVHDVIPNLHGLKMTQAIVKGANV